jgi:hypothetical protein
VTTQTGFGKVQPKQKAAQKSKAKRVAASRKYDEMKKSGVPEFNIYVRIKGQQQWLPAGSIAVNRSNQINQAVFEQEQELLKGVFRLFPKLRKHQNNLEYGHRLKEFKDEPIQVAVRPQPTTANFIQTTVTNIKERFSSLLQRR